jgi:hypothetical protein
MDSSNQKTYKLCLSASEILTLGGTLKFAMEFLGQHPNIMDEIEQVHEKIVKCVNETNKNEKILPITLNPVKEEDVEPISPLDLNEKEEEDVYDPIDPYVDI